MRQRFHQSGNDGMTNYEGSSNVKETAASVKVHFHEAS